MERPFISMSPVQGPPRAFVRNNWYLLLGCQSILPSDPLFLLGFYLVSSRGEQPSRAVGLITFQEAAPGKVVLVAAPQARV